MEELDEEKNEELRMRTYRYNRALRLIGYKIQDCLDKELLEDDEALALKAVLGEALWSFAELPDEIAVKDFLARSLDEHRRERDRRERERYERRGK